MSRQKTFFRTGLYRSLGIALLIAATCASETRLQIAGVEGSRNETAKERPKPDRDSHRGGKTAVRDSYLDALKYSRTSDEVEGVRAEKKAAPANRREYVQGPVYVGQTSYGSGKPEPQYHRESFSFPATESYSPPTRGYTEFKDGVQNSYGPPRVSYGPPNGYQGQHGYREHGNSYLPQQAYGPPSLNISPSPSFEYGNPHGLSEMPYASGFPKIDFSWPLALKLNAFTLAKILLKLVIFKMIVKFIAIICLLLFIPKLEIKKGNNNNDDDDDSRNFNSLEATFDPSSLTMDRLNALASVVASSVEKYEQLNEARSNSSKVCTGLHCRLIDYSQLLESYALEEKLLPRITKSSS